MKRIYSLLICSIGLCSCIKDGSSPGPASGSDGKAIIEFREAVDYSVTTRASPEDESRILELDLLLFQWQREKETPENFMSRLSIRPDEMDQYVKTTDNGYKYFEINLKDLGGNEIYSRPMLFANCQSLLDEAFAAGRIDENTSREEVYNMFSIDHAPWCEPGGAFPPIPMFGIGGAIAPGYGESETPRTTINLLRPFARVDIGVDTGNSGQYGSLRDDFQIDRVYYPVTYATTMLLPKYQYTMITGPDTPHVPRDSTRIVDFRRSVDFVEGPNFKMEGTIYMPESSALDLETPYDLKFTGRDGVSTEHKGADAEMMPYNGSFLIIQATYKGEPNRFYRVNFDNGTHAVPVIRNYLYDINITAVDKRGYDTMEEAAMDHFGGSGIESDLVIGQDQEEYVYYEFDHKYYIGINRSNSIGINLDAQTIIVKVITNYGGTQNNWTCVADPSTPWGKVEKVNAGNGLSSMHITLERNDGEDLRQFQAYIYSGPLTMGLYLSQWNR